jgi:hypothetical protein
LQEKYIILLIKDKDKDNIKNSNYQMGKIYIQIKLEKLNNELKSPNNKNENQITKAKTIDSLYRHNKEDSSFIDKIAKSIKIQNIDKNDIKLYDINSIISKESINKLKEYVENKKKIEDLLPKDINSLKSYNIGLLNEYKILNHNYNNFLIKIIKNNEELKQKSNKYENLNEGLEDEMKELTQELQASKELFDNNKSSKKYISKSMKKMNPVTISNKNLKEKNQFEELCNIYKKLYTLGYKIDDNDLDSKEKQLSDNILKNIQIDDSDNNVNKSIQNEKDIELGNNIVKLIEKGVNELYKKKLIEHIKIDQIDAKNYTFTGNKMKINIKLKIENKQLLVDSGDNFNDWLITNFSVSEN